jgi:hypothetical protein
VEADAVMSRARVLTGFELAEKGTGLTGARGAAEAGGCAVLENEVPLSPMRLPPYRAAPASPPSSP